MKLQRGTLRTPTWLQETRAVPTIFFVSKILISWIFFKITYELILYAKLNESGSWNEVSCSKKDSQMNDFYLKLKLTSICFTHTSAIVITIWYMLLHRWEMWRSLSCMAFSIYEVVSVAWHWRIWVVVYIKKNNNNNNNYATDKRRKRLRSWSSMTLCQERIKGTEKASAIHTLFHR